MVAESMESVSQPIAVQPTQRILPRVRRPPFGIFDWLFWFVMFSVNLQEILEIFAIDTIYKPYRVTALGLAVLAFPSLVRQWSEISRYFLPLLAAYAYGFLMTVFLGGEQATYFIIPYIGISLAMLVCSCAVSSRHSLYVGCAAYLIGFFVSVILGVLTENTGIRLSAMFDNANYAGYAACISIILLSGPNLRIPFLLRYLLIISLFAFIFFTISRTAIVVATLTLGTQIINDKRYLNAFIILAFLGVFANLIWESESFSFGSDPQTKYYRFSSSKIEQGAEDRLAMARAGLTVAAENGFIGIGMDQFRQRYYTRFFYRPTRGGDVGKLGLHNSYMTVLCEWGIVSFILLMITLYRVFAAASRRPEVKSWIYGFIWCSLGMGLTGNIIDSPHFWLLFGFSVQLIRFSGTSSNRPVLPQQEMRNALV